jgi:hypothetical protein
MPTKKSHRPGSPRCAFIDDDVRCRKRGVGDPPLCAEHAAPAHDIFAQALDQLFAHPTVKTWADSAQGWVQTRVSLLDQFIAGAIPFAPGAAPGRPPGPRPGPGFRPPPPRPSPAEDPRSVLHFGAKEPLTVAKVKERKKMLAAMVHPDRGGSTEAMAKINNAADTLLKTLK